jgi:hypothetical protein
MESAHFEKRRAKMTDRMKEFLDEAKAIEEELNLFHEIPALAEGYSRMIYSLTCLADRAGIPEMVVPAEINDPRRLDLALCVVTEVTNRIRCMVDRDQKRDAVASAVAVK